MRRDGESDGWTSAISRFLVMRSRSAYRPHHVLLAVLYGVCVELGVIPALIVIGGIRIDRAFGWPPLLPQAWVPFGATGCFAIGVPWLAWSIIWQDRKSVV